MVNAVSEVAGPEGIKPANFYFERFAPKETTGGDAETGAPRSPEKIAAEGDTMTRCEALSSLETGRLEFRKEDSFAHLDARMGLELAVSELDDGPADRGAAAAVPAARRGHHALRGRRHHAGPGGVRADQRGVPRVPLHGLRQPHAAGVLPPARRARADGRDLRSGARQIFARVAQDHLDVVDAFERNDKERVREVIMAHARDAKETMAGAIDAKEAGR